MTRRTMQRLVGGIAVVLAAACSSDGASGVRDVDAVTPSAPRVPAPGTMSLVLADAPNDLGAVVVRISGPAIAGFATEAHTWDGTEMRRDTVTLMIRGQLARGEIGVLDVADRTGAYRVEVLDAAGGRDAGYRRIDPAMLDMRVARR